MQSYLDKLQQAYKQLDLHAVEEFADSIQYISQQGATIFICGNGGSAALASHMAIDLQKAVDARAIALNDIAVMTAVGNDISYDDIFSYPLERLCRFNDLVVGISASGASQNVINCLDTAKALGCRTACLTGHAGADRPRPLHKICDHSIIVESNSYGIVEDIHCSIMHVICERLR